MMSLFCFVVKKEFAYFMDYFQIQFNSHLIKSMANARKEIRNEAASIHSCLVYFILEHLVLPDINPSRRRRRFQR